MAKQKKRKKPTKSTKKTTKQKATKSKKMAVKPKKKTTKPKAKVTKKPKPQAAAAKKNTSAPKSGAASVKDILAQLKKLGDEKVRDYNVRSGAGNNQFGVKLGDVRNLAKKIKPNHELALALWATGNLEAQLVTT